MKKHTRHTKIAALITLAVIGTALSAPAQATLLPPTDDTFVQADNAGPFGTGATIPIKHTYGTNSSNSTSGSDRIGLFGFDLTGQASVITNATLSLNYTSGGEETNSGRDYNFTVYGISDGGTNELFDENTLTFSSFGYGSSTLHGSFDPTGLTSLGNFTTTGVGGTVNFSNASLLSFINADANDRVSFIIFRNSQRSNTFNSTIFATKENANSALRPTLALAPNAPVVAAVPEPTSLALLGLGGLALVATRRRQRAK